MHQNQDVDGGAQQSKELSSGMGGGTVDQQSEEIVNDDGCDHQKDVDGFAPSIKEDAGDQQEQISEQLVFYGKIQNQKGGKKAP